jgi:hypothetical protein
MARVNGNINFSGTIGDICFYMWEGQLFARKKSSLTKDRVLKDIEFAGLRKHAGDMGRASKIASEIYRQLPADIKGRWIFRAIAGHAASLLYKGKSEEQVKNALYRKYIELPVAEEKITTKSRIRNKKGISSGLVTSVSSKHANKFWKNIFLKDWEKQGKDAFFFNRAWHHRQPFNPDTIPRRSEYFMGLGHASQ